RTRGGKRDRGGSMRLTLHHRRGRASAGDLRVHAASDRAARRRLRAFARGVRARSHRSRAVRASAELHADATLNLGPSCRHHEEERGDGEHGGDAVQRGTLHGNRVGTGAKVGGRPRLSTSLRVKEPGGVTATRLSSPPRATPLVSELPPDALEGARGTAPSPSSLPWPSPTTTRRSRSG